MSAKVLVVDDEKGSRSLGFSVLIKKPSPSYVIVQTVRRVLDGAPADSTVGPK